MAAFSLKRTLVLHSRFCRLASVVANPRITSEPSHSSNNTINQTMFPKRVYSFIRPRPTISSNTQATETQHPPALSKFTTLGNKKLPIITHLMTRIEDKRTSVDGD